MDRPIVYIGAIPQDTDQLNTNRNVMTALGYAIQAFLGTATAVDGLACTATTPASMSVNVGPGAIYSQQNVDNSAYGSLAADTTDQIMKQGIILGTTTFNCPAPATAGYSVVYLVEAIYEDVDSGSTVLPYYNASNPSQAYSGPSNSGISQNTVRKGVCQLILKTGVPAATNTQVTPTPDAGYVGLYAITVANGQTTITSANIAQIPTAPFIFPKLPALLSTFRQKLSANTSFYVSTTGSDSTGVGSTAAPWATIQRAISYVLQNIDTGGFSVTINLANGTYGGAVLNSPLPGGGQLILNGNSASPSSVIVYVSSGSAIQAANGGNLTVQNLSVSSNLGIGLNASVNGIISFSNVVFGGCGVAQMLSYDSSNIVINGNYSISGASPYHMTAHHNSVIYVAQNTTVTITGTPNFLGAFADAEVNGSIVAGGMTFAGSATGIRYNASTNGVIATNSGGNATYFPGNAAGTIANGGVYV